MNFTDTTLKDAVAIGELLVDFISAGVSDQGNPVMEANPGGAPCNVLSMLSKTGKRTGFIGRVGDDIFGRQLREAIGQCGIEHSALAVDKEVRTTLAFVKTLERGEREFSFYRNPGADMRLCEEDVSGEYVRSFRLLHFGTLSSTHDSCRAATRKACAIAREAGMALSFDPNLRESLWDDLEKAGAEMRYGLSQADIVKISDNEIEFLLPDTVDPVEGAVRLAGLYPNIKVLFATLGADGAAAVHNGRVVRAATFTEVPAVEKTGAGDTFMGAALSKILDAAKLDFSDDELKEILIFANAAATLCASRKGALKSMPSTEETVELIHKKGEMV